MRNNTYSPISSILFFAVALALCLSALSSSAQAAGNRFVALEDGTVQDKKTGLNWAAKDNGADITWSAATDYCNRFSEGGHTDWRMPTATELATLYGNSSKTNTAGSINVITPAISISAPYVWSSEKRTGNKSITFGFNYGAIKRLYRGDGANRRALPVR